MKTKQQSIRAKFTAENRNARNRANEMETIGGSVTGAPFSRVTVIE